MRKQKGFSLIELLIVVAIILIIAAIAIPNLLRSRIAANEASAVGSLRTINTAEVTYASTYPNLGFSANMGSLGGVCSGGTAPTSTASCLIDDTLAKATAAATSKSGYFFTYAGDGNTPSVGYTLKGDPVQYNQTGLRHFFTDMSGVIRFETTDTAATVTSSPLQ